MNCVLFLDTFPQELIDRVIEESADSSATLRSCALVCKAFLHPSQALIFSHVGLFFYWFTPNLKPERLYHVLSRSPHLARHIKSLAICYNLREPPGQAVALIDTVLFPIIVLLSDLQSLKIHGIVWTHLPARFTNALYDICRRSTLSKLSLREIRNLSISEFSQLVASPSLTDLSIVGLTIVLPTNGETITGDQLQLTRLAMKLDPRTTDAIMAWLVRGDRVSHLRHMRSVWDVAYTPHLQTIIDVAHASLTSLFLVTDLELSTERFPVLSLAHKTSLRTVTLSFSRDITKDTAQFAPFFARFLESSPSSLTTISLGFDLRSSWRTLSPQNWDIFDPLLSRERFPGLEIFAIFLQGSATTRLEMTIATIKLALPRLEADGILKLHYSLDVPPEFLDT
ncbi:hypothetical protein B0H11DRAFT_1955698 [Mycena galericulata]|nr:hypothetical protein B0H11DRAFT_1955698 [Mycena galericulata]